VTGEGAIVSERSFADTFIAQLDSAGDSGFELVESFATEARAEDLYLDFKEKEDASLAELSPGDKRHLAKAISGFAHSEGGLIVWGIRASREGNDLESSDVARDIRPIANLDAFQANLNATISQATNPPVSGVRNIKVLKPSPPNCGYVVTYIPAGSLHRADWCNNNFYKRSGSSFYPMEPFDIRDVIMRSGYPKIRLDFSWHPQGSGMAGHRLYQLMLSVSNAGPTILESWKLVVECPPAISARGFPGFSRPLTYFPVNELVGGDRQEVISHPAFGIKFHPIMPEDSVQILGQGAPAQFHYQMDAEVANAGGSMIQWRFYGSDIPAQRGDIVVGPGSYCEF
jgi:schlafen family protein